MLDPVIYGLLLIGTVLLIVVLILTLERFFLKVKYFSGGGNRRSVLSAGAEVVDLNHDG